MYYNSTLYASRLWPAYNPFFLKRTRFFMKVTAIILIILLFAVGSINASTVTAQTLSEVKVSFGLSQTNLETAFAKIESQTDFRFAFRKNEISSIKTINLSAQTRSVQQVLDELLKGTGLAYKQINNSIIIFESVEPKAEKQVVADQIKGTVKDEDGTPLPGVSVKIKGKPTGTITDVNGAFAVPASQNDVLVFSYIGYATIERAVSGTQPITITMKVTVGTLDAVVVIGYGTTTKRNNTGSVTSVTAKDIDSQPVTDPLAALEGRVAGLNISSVTGYPGSGYNVHLRGQNSISGGNDPLYIVDGVPFISTSLSQFAGANGSQSPLSSINPNDIERIDILKDADATAIYGSRGANGVILITTKQGKAGKPEFDFNVYSGISKVNHMVNMLNTTDYLALRREAFANDKVTPTVDKAPDLLSWDPTLNQNWQKILIGKSANLTEASGSLKGGDEQTNFLISGTVRDEKIVLPGDLGYKRAALNLSLNHQSVDKKFKINASIKYTSDQNNTIATDITQYYNLPPNYPIYDAKGAYYWFGNEQNPLAFLERSSDSQTHTLFGNTSISYMILPGLNLKTTAGFTQMGIKQTQTYPQPSFNPATYAGSQAYYGNNDLNSYIVEPQFDYTRKISKGTFNALVGGTWQQSVTTGQSVIGNGYASDEQLEDVLAATSVTAQTYNYVKYRYTSIFGRVTYNWDEKYIVNGTFRRDGSSRFGPNKRYGNFGAVGAAWLFSNESFIKDKLSFLSFGKLRGSFGVVGNDQIGDYQYLDSWSPASFSYGGSSTLYPSRFPNPNYSWEVNRKIEGGIDLGFLNDRILLTTNYYRNRSDNQLVGYTLSSQSGFTSYTANLPALVQNTGWEFELTTTNVQKKNFNWNTSFNLTFARTKLLAYPNLANSADAEKYVIGQPLNIVRGYDFTGVNPQTGVPQFKDLNNNGVIDDPDLVTLGSTTPDLYGGIQNTFNYKSFSFNFFFQFVKQNGPGLDYGYLLYPNGILQNSDASALNRWKQAGDQTNIPGATATAGTAIYTAYQDAYRLSSANWVDASFIRLKNVSLKYNFAYLAKGLKLKNLSVYVQGQNLFTITKYKGFDPETQGYALPPLSVYTAGVQVTF
jgi:TonB-linked SusC/RagA family outer membrane protein